MFDRRGQRHWLLALQPQRTGRGEQVEHRGEQRTAAHAEAGDQYERSEQSANDRAQRIRRIQLTAGLARLSRQ